MINPDRVVVVVRGGIVEDVDGPEGLFIDIQDYDIEGVPDGALDLKVDRNGDTYFETTYVNTDPEEGTRHEY